MSPWGDFIVAFKNIQGLLEIHADNIEKTRNSCKNPIGTCINLLFQKPMPVPMQLHTACVCDTMGSAWASREIVWAF
jgi:hypothetical protein